MLTATFIAKLTHKLQRRRQADLVARLSPEQMRDVGLDTKDFERSRIGEPDDLVLQCLGWDESRRLLGLSSTHDR